MKLLHGQYTSVRLAFVTGEDLLSRFGGADVGGGGGGGSDINDSHDASQKM